MPSKHPLAEAVTANPLLIDPTRADLLSSALSYLSANTEAKAMLDEGASASVAGDSFWGENGADHPYRPYTVTNGILQIPVQGVLLNRFSYAFGRWATGYQYIEKALARGLADGNVRAIALVTDSPGGEVAGCFELADKIFEARGKKPVRAFAADHAYSAAYALASAASQIVVTRSGGTGSVGVVTAHVDYSEALANQGIKVTFIFAGAHKVDGNPYEALPDSVKARMQERIDRIYGVFTSSVARNRSMSEKSVRVTEALTFDAQDSVAKGFADRIGALDEEMVIFEEAAIVSDFNMKKDESEPDKVDVDFVQKMIPHHESAIEMASSYIEESKDSEIKKLAEGIKTSQETEVKFMLSWLKKHGKSRKEGEKKMSSYTNEQMEAAVASATESGRNTDMLEGAKAAQTRITAILSSEAGKAKPKAALALALKSSDSAEIVIGLLADMPEEKAEAPKVEGKAKTPFEHAMEDTGNPGVGASDDVSGSGGPTPDFADSFFGSIGMKPRSTARN